MAGNDSSDADAAGEVPNREEYFVEQRLNLHAARLEAVTAVLRERGVKRVLDLGCGEGKLIRRLLEDRQFQEIVGVDVSPSALEIAARRFRVDPAKTNRRVTLLQGALTYRDRRLSGFDGAAVVEVIEHLDPPRLAAFEQVVFETARPGVVVLTTPNREYNQLFEGLPPGSLRHRDHRFEWTRAEFQAWANGVAERYGYTVEFRGIGPVDSNLGSASQMAVFSQIEKRSNAAD